MTTYQLRMDLVIQLCRWPFSKGSKGAYVKFHLSDTSVAFYAPPHFCWSSSFEGKGMCVHVRVQDNDVNKLDN